MSDKRKILLIDTVHPLISEEFEKRGYQCDSFDGNDRDRIKSIIREYTGAIIRSKFILDKDVLQHATNLKFIGRVGSGMENIDVEFAEKQGIHCFNSPEGNRDAVGEQAVGLLLALFRKITHADKQVREGKWDREGNRGIEIGGKTIGIIGYGNTGSAFARKISGFGAKVIAYDKYKKDYSDSFVTETDMNTIFHESDILSLHLPLTEETTYLVTREYLEKFRKNIYLINTSRGKVVNTDHLVEALKQGMIHGAALDVLEFEMHSFEDLDSDKLPDAFKYLAHSDKVVLSPHIAGWTIESKYKLAKVLVEKIMNMLNKENE